MRLCIDPEANPGLCLDCFSGLARLKPDMSRLTVPPHDQDMLRGRQGA